MKEYKTNKLEIHWKYAGKTDVMEAENIIIYWKSTTIKVSSCQLANLMSSKVLTY